MRIAIQSLEEFDAEVFRAWLEQRGEDEIVGQAGQANRCPLANCLNEVLGLQDSMDNFFVTAESISGRNREGKRISDYDTPPWVYRFVNTLDDEACYDVGAEVTRENCEGILRRIGYCG